MNKYTYIKITEAPKAVASGELKKIKKTRLVYDDEEWWLGRQCEEDYYEYEDTRTYKEQVKIEVFSCSEEKFKKAYNEAYNEFFEGPRKWSMTDHERMSTIHGNNAAMKKMTKEGEIIIDLPEDFPLLGKDVAYANFCYVTDENGNYLVANNEVSSEDAWYLGCDNMGLPCDDIDNFMIEQIKNL